MRVRLERLPFPLERHSVLLRVSDSPADRADANFEVTVALSEKELDDLAAQVEAAIKARSPRVIA